MSDIHLFLSTLERKAKETKATGNSWEGYLILLHFIEGVHLRMMQIPDLDRCEIDEVFTVELNALAHLVADLFPQGSLADSFAELETFLEDEVSPARLLSFSRDLKRILHEQVAYDHSRYSIEFIDGIDSRKTFPG